MLSALTCAFGVRLNYPTLSADNYNPFTGLVIRVVRFRWRHARLTLGKNSLVLETQKRTIRQKVV